MSPPVIPLASRIARLTDTDVQTVQYIFDHYAAESSEGPCMPWQGSVIGQMPSMKYQGKMASVRRVMEEACTGEPVPAYVKLSSGCATLFCVNPQHSLHQEIMTPERMVSAEQVQQHIEATDVPTVAEAIDMVYSREQPWDPQALATEFDYPLHLIVEAIRQITEEGA